MGRGRLKAGRNVLSSAAVGLAPLLQGLRQQRRTKEWKIKSMEQENKRQEEKAKKGEINYKNVSVF